MKEKVMIVDDEIELLRTLSFILWPLNYHIEKASDGVEALKKILSAKESGEPFDLLITDIQMPNMTGLELLKELKLKKVEIPALVMTAYGDKELLVDIIHLGCVGYIDKPFDEKQLLDSVYNVLEDARNKHKFFQDELDKSFREKEVLRNENQCFRQDIRKLHEQIDSALYVYQNMVLIDKINCPIPFEYRHRPYCNLGGDYLAFKPHKNGVHFLMADVAGNDIGASYHHVVIKLIFDSFSGDEQEGERFFIELNRALIKHYNQDRLITVLLLSVDLNNSKLFVYNAGHTPLIYVPFDIKRPDFLWQAGMALGMFDKVRIGHTVVPLRPYDRFFFFTDGVIPLFRMTAISGAITLEPDTSLISRHLHKPFDLLMNELWNEILASPNKICDDMMLAGFEVPGLNHV